MRRFTLENLDCANCALKIENELNTLESVRFASINFATRVLRVDSDDLDEVKKTLKRIEPGVTIRDVKDRTATGRRGTVVSLSTLALSILFFALAHTVLHPSNHLSLVLLIASWITAGYPVIFRAIRNLFNGQLLDENFLMTLSTIGAFAINAPAESAGVMIFYRAGEMLQERALNRSRRSIQSLLEIKADVAHVLRDGAIHDVTPEEIAAGDSVIVRPGERVPVDGTIVEGRTHVDKSALTGESLPQYAEPGAMLMSGSINIDGAVTLRTDKPFSESQVSRILSLAEESSARKARTEKFMTTFARYYTPAVVGAATLIAVLPTVLFGAHFSDWLHRALVLLVISCPCALVISIPLGYFGGIGGAARKGILVKGSQPLDALSTVSTVVFDKTGTLTLGDFSVIDIIPENGFPREEILGYAAATEAHSNHPIARSLRAAYSGSVDNDEIGDYREMPGFGVSARIRSHEILVGNDRMLHNESIEHAFCRTDGTSVHVVIDRVYAGCILVADTPRGDAKETIERLHRDKVRVVMLTGDSHPAAQHIADSLGIDEFHSELLPSDKVSILDRIIGENHDGKVAFAGDGINDAPVIARADIGIAMGAAGSDAAIESADVVLMTDTPSRIPDAIEHARKTRAIIFQNIFFALGIKLAFAVLGVFGIATMWEAVFADVGVAILAIFNAMRALNR